MRSPHSRIRYWLCECWSAWSRLVNLIEIKSSWIQIREQNYQSLKVAFLTLNILELHSSLDDLVSCYEIWPQQPPSRLVPLLVCFKLKCHALSCLTFRSSGAAVLGLRVADKFMLVLALLMLTTSIHQWCSNIEDIEVRIHQQIL